MAVTSQTLRLTAALRAELLRVTDAHEATMIEAWARAWDEVAPDLRATLDTIIRDAGEGRVSRAMLLRNSRLRKSLGHIADRLESLCADAGVPIAGDLRALCAHAANAQTAIIASQLPAVGRDLVDADAWSRTEDRQLDAMVRRTTQQITKRSYPISDRAYAVVQRELVRGVAAGSNPRVTARRMVARAEGGFNGGLSRALTIARTETLDAFRAAEQLGEKPHRKVLEEWEWHAALSSRTCPACLSMHGQRFPLSQSGPEGHQNCRCARLPVTKSWADLGFEGIAEPVSVTPSAEDFFGGLSVADQRGILGSAGHAAWSQGRWPMSEWAKRQRNDGWRDSYVPAKPPKVSAA